MNLYDLKTPLHKMPLEEVTLFVRNLRFQRTLDNSPPKKEKKEKKKKELDPFASLTKEEKEMVLLLIKNEKEKELLLNV